MKIRQLPSIEDRHSAYRASVRTRGHNPHLFRRYPYSKPSTSGDCTNKVLDVNPASVNLTMSLGGDQMGIASAALAKAAELRKKKGSKPAPTSSAKKSTSTKKPRAASSTRGTNEAENKKVASMYEAGKSYGEISDAMGWTGKGDWPHSYTHGVINRLRKAGMLGYRRKPETKKGKK